MVRTVSLILCSVLHAMFVAIMSHELNVSNVQEQLFTSVQQGDLKSLIELLSKYPSGINSVDEVW